MCKFHVITELEFRKFNWDYESKRDNSEQQNTEEKKNLCIHSKLFVNYLTSLFQSVISQAKIFY